jgi:hypothetical protein
MKSRVEAKRLKIIKNKKVSSPKKKSGASSTSIPYDRISEMLISEGNESFRHYIEWLGLSHDPKLVILSSIHHYYYDAEEMKNVKTVVNLKELNQIKDIDNFLNSMFIILPPRSYLIGCFIDNKKQSAYSFRKRNADDGSKKMNEEESYGIISRIPLLNTIFNFLDSKTNKYMSGKTVNAVLVKNGFNVMDMTELDGLTYFCAQNQRTAEN